MVRLHTAKGKCEHCQHETYCEWASKIRILLRALVETQAKFPDILLIVDQCNDYKEEKNGA